MRRSRTRILFVVVALGCGGSSTTVTPTPIAPEPASAVQPAEPGPVVASEPIDTDGDRVPDDVDGCPADDEVYNGTDDEDGCPDCSGSITLDRISYPIPIFFGRDLATTRDREVDFMAAVLVAHSEIRRIEVRGYAATGERDPNGLSGRRANAVVEALATRGVSRDRLVPIVGGRRASTSPANDRRVEFAIVEGGRSSYPLCENPFPGCSAGDGTDIVLLTRIYFARGQAEPTSDSVPVLDATATTLVANAFIRLVDVRGDASTDERRVGGLATQRAQAVIEALVSRGVERERLAIGSLGPLDEPQRGEDARNVSFEIVAPGLCGQ